MVPGAHDGIFDLHEISHAAVIAYVCALSEVGERTHRTVFADARAAQHALFDLGTRADKGVLQYIFGAQDRARLDDRAAVYVVIGIDDCAVADRRFLGNEHPIGREKPNVGKFILQMPALPQKENHYILCERADFCFSAAQAT